MGALVSKALRPIRNFNVENRAHRVISKEKPSPAPMYPDNVEDLKRALELDPNLADKLDKKDPGLDARLKDVYVTSHGRPEDDITREKRAKNETDRPLPQDRGMVEEFEYGFKEPEKLRYGKTTLRHAIEFISAHQTNPNEITAARIATEYKLDENDVKKILKYFKTFEIYLPKTKTTPAVFAGPGNMRKQLEKQQQQQIEHKRLEPNMDPYSSDSGSNKL